MNMIEAYNKLGDDGKIKQKRWGDMYLKKNLKLYIKHETHYQLYDERCMFYLDDILADDWEVVE
jgi:hypothetical protein